LKLLIIFVGKTTEEYLVAGIDGYCRRLKNYLNVAVETVKAATAKDRSRALQEEEKNILSRILPGDYLVLLDERGAALSSRELSGEFARWMNQGRGRVVFITGGAFGVSEELRKKSNFQFSLSRLTFTHQMVRLILVEQVYRAMTILKNEGYHHD
jgi:23S rRNA (pseudouridine1915-N3)-methyltransferase